MDMFTFWQTDSVDEKADAILISFKYDTPAQ